MNPKATITIDLDDEGHPRASVVFDPPLPERPNGDDPAAEEAWLESVPSTQLAAFIVMDNIMDMFGDDIELESVSMTGPGNGTKH